MCDDNKLLIQKKTPFNIRGKRWLEAKFYKILLRFYLQGGRIGSSRLLKKIFVPIADWYGRTQHGGKIVTLQEACFWIDKAETVILSTCYCRDTFKNCKEHLNSCIKFSDTDIFLKVENKDTTRKITKDQAKEILHQCSSKGFFHFLSWCSSPNLYSICNCCTCCCVPFRLFKEYEIASALKKGNLIACFDKINCTNCMLCIDYCKFGGLRVLKNGSIEISQDNCFGCGMCEAACPNNSIKLVERIIT